MPLKSEDETSLRDGVFVEPGGVVAVEARLKRGNGPLTAQPLNFFLLGDGSLSQVEVATALMSLAQRPVAPPPSTSRHLQIRMKSPRLAWCSSRMAACSGTRWKSSR